MQTRSRAGKRKRGAKHSVPGAPNAKRPCPEEESKAQGSGSGDSATAGGGSFQNNYIYNFNNNYFTGSEATHVAADD